MIDRNFVLNLAHQDSDTSEYLMSLYNIPKQMKAKTIVEIGAGRSSFALVAAANETDGYVTSIDVGGAITLNRVDNGQELMKNEKRLIMIEDNSLKVKWPPNVPIDFLFWDSEHTPDLSRREIIKWFPLVRSGGIIMAHDTGHEDPDKQGARMALDKYLKTNPRHYTVVHLLDTKIIGMSILVRL